MDYLLHRFTHLRCISLRLKRTMVGITDVKSLIRISLTAALLTLRSKVCLACHVGL